MNDGICIVGIIVEDRTHEAPRVQEILTEHNDAILSRSGIPLPNRDAGLITITMECTAKEREELMGALGALEHVETQCMRFA